jgi:Glycosyltransferase 61
MPFKLALVEQFGIERGFRLYCQMLGMPEVCSVAPRTLVSLRDFAKQHALEFTEIYKAGEPFRFPPPSIVGPNDSRPLEGTSRTFFVACLSDASVANHSTLITVNGDVPLLEFQGDEREEVADLLVLDRFVFHATSSTAWIIGEGEPVVEIDEAFGSLIGPHCQHFGHWLWEFLPKYLTARASGALPNVPLIVDERLGPSLRSALAMLRAETVEIIELPAATRARVRRLWCSPPLMYAPICRRNDVGFGGLDSMCFPAARFRPTLEAMASCAALAGTSAANGGRVYLARREHLVRKLLNGPTIEALASSRGFTIFYPEEHSFVEQVRKIRSSAYILGPEGSAMYLNFFAMPGTKLCILNHPFTHDTLTYTYLLQELGVDVTIFTGPSLRLNAGPGWPNYGHQQYADYEIDEIELAAFLDAWLPAMTISA